jgi:ABC-type sugar transport system substrate-binding protein
MNSRSIRLLKILIPILVVVTLAIITWVWRRPQPQTKIVVILPSATNPFWIDVRKGAEEAAAELGEAYSVRVQASLDQDANSQVDLLNAFLSRKDVDVLVLGPASDTETVPTVAKYSAVGIPIVLIDTELNPEAIMKNKVDIAAFIGSDNVDGGRKAAKAMSEALKGKLRRVLLIEGSHVHQSAIDRAAGFNEVSKRENLEVVTVNGEWKRDKAQELVASQFSRGKFGGIFASNDDMALGAVTGAKARNLSREEWPVIIGFDATRDGLTAVTNGDMYATVAQDAHGLGRRGVMDALKALKHDPTLLRRDFQEVNVRLR